MAKTEIVADAEELRWRGMTKKCQARWDEVLDYYDVTSSPRRRNSIVKTNNGDLKISAEMNTRALRAAIAARAVHAKTETWGLLGTRPEEEQPRVFAYSTSAINTYAVIGWAHLVALPLLLLLSDPAQLWRNTFSLIQDVPVIATQMTWPVMIFIALLMLCFPVLFFIVPPLKLYFPEYRNLKRRRNQRISVSRTQIIFEDGPQRIEAKWNGILNYYSRKVSFSKREFVIETQSGEITFVSELYESNLLLELVRRFATNATATEWNLSVIDEVIGGDAARWSGKSNGVGRRIFSYRTRMNRIFFNFLPFSITLFFLFLSWITPHLRDDPDTPAPNPIGLWVLAAMSFSIGAVLWLQYQFVSIQLDQDGIHRCTLRREQFIRWGEVEYLGRHWLGAWEVFGRGKRLRFWPHIGESIQLCDEIARRAVNAEVLPSWWREDSECGGT